MSALTSTTSSSTRPGWVLHNGDLCHVSEFAALPRGERPQTTCPLCEEAVTLKLGKVRAHHYAHTHDCDCALNRPETALHFNVKFHFYRELQRAIDTPFVELCLEQRCQAKGCHARRNWVWAQDWDEVRVEYRMDSIRPDIALLKEGKVEAALEILVTHAVDEHKEALLQELDIPWAEIKADESLYEGKSAWKATDPLPAARQHPYIPDWTCPDCQQKQLERRHQQEAEAKQREFERLNYAKVYADRMVDFFYPTGKRHREIFEVLKVVENGQEARTELRSKRRGVLRFVEGKLTQEILNQFVNVAKAEVEQLKGDSIIVDQVMPWREWRPSRQIVAADPISFPFRYYWRGDQNAWVPVEQPPSTSSRSVSLPTPFEFGSYPCIGCGRVTKDWCIRYGHNHCRCNDCVRKQRAEPLGTR